MAELPFMATENIMMDAVKAGGDRRGDLHERIRQPLHRRRPASSRRREGENDLLERICGRSFSERHRWSS